uniref:IRG-type G domain-containing protein n=1 Tax=Acrobeloides nanus TaxID=290746 RepID=A0A914CQH6_9BILA
MATPNPGFVQGLGATVGLLEFTGYAITEIMGNLFGAKPCQEISRKDLDEKIQIARHKIGIDDKNFYNFAFVGHAKTGKSSLINAIRGLSNRDEGAALTDTAECTEHSRYYTFKKDFNMQHVRFYDLPGSGTTSHPAENYFEDKCLYAFDCLIILIQETLAEDEIQMAKIALKYSLPVCFVRSKCDSDLYNKHQNGEIDGITRAEIDAHISSLSNFFRFQMKKAGLPENLKCFFVSAPSLRKLMLNQKRESYQEIELLHFLLLEALKSRQAGDLSTWRRFKNVDKHRIVSIKEDPIQHDIQDETVRGDSEMDQTLPRSHQETKNAQNNPNPRLSSP